MGWTPTRLSRRDAAAYLGLSKVTLARWAMLGKGPQYVVIGNKAMYMVAHLDHYLTNGEPKKTGFAKTV